MLNAEHLKYLNDRAITDAEIIESRGYESTDVGLQIPLCTLPDALAHGYEVRLDKVIDGRKFNRPHGQSNVLTIHPFQLDNIRELDKTLFIVEGTTRVDALAQLNLPAVGLTGCYGWKGSNGEATQTLSDWHSVPLKGRDVVVVFDGDVVTNVNVNEAYHALSEFLQRKGALRVRAATLPDDLGLDDWFARDNTLFDLPQFLHEDVVRLKREKKSRQQRASEMFGTPYTDVALAQMWIESSHFNARYVTDTDTWVSYSDGCWRKDSSGVVAQSHILTVLRQCAEYALKKGDADVATDLSDYHRLGTVTALAKAMPETHAKDDDFDSDAWMLNFANCTYDLRNHEVRAHDPNDLLRGKTKASYDPNATSPRFDRFMIEVLPNADVRKYVQQILGASLVGETLSEALPVFVGAGRNGKSVLVKAIGCALGYDFYGPVDKSLLVSAKFESHPTKLMALKGKRLVVASETEEGDKFAAASLKMLTGGDDITARGMRQDQQTFSPTHSMILLTNNLPQVDGNDKAIWARLKLINFDVSFLGREDRTLEETLRGESDGIMLWLMRGLQQFVDNGRRFDEPASVSAATVGWQMEENTFLAFIKSQGTIDDSARVTSGDLNMAYMSWCEANDVEPLRARAVGAAALSLGLTQWRSNKGRGWQGVRIHGVSSEAHHDTLKEAEAVFMNDSEATTQSDPFGDTSSESDGFGDTSLDNPSLTNQQVRVHIDLKSDGMTDLFNPLSSTENSGVSEVAKDLEVNPEKIRHPSLGTSDQAKHSDGFNLGCVTKADFPGLTHDEAVQQCNSVLPWYEYIYCLPAWDDDDA